MPPARASVVAASVACLTAAALATPAARATPATTASLARQSPTEWCDSARRQVVEWSLTEAAGRGRPHVTAIRTLATRIDRVLESPANGVILRCAGRATLSNGVTTKVSFGFRAIDGTWYLFLRRPRA